MITVSRCFPLLHSCQCIKRLPVIPGSRRDSGILHQLNFSSLVAEVPGDENKPLRIRKKRKVKVLDSENPPEYLLNHFQTNSELKILKSFPPSYFQKKQNSHKDFYIADENVAKIIAGHATARDDAPILEINPGTGILTRQLLKTSKQKVHLFEPDEKFNLNEITDNERVSLTKADFTGIWSLTYRDKLDGGSRIQKLLGDKLVRKDWTEEPSGKIVGATGCYNFFKHLIYSIINQSSIFAFGRCEMFLVVPPMLYIHLTCSSEAGYLLYRSMTVLFQVFFEYEFIQKVPRSAFLPWLHAFKREKHNKLSKINTIDEDSYYLVRIVPRRDVFDICAADDMQALLFFVKQNMISRANFVIPVLEKWIPHCGIRLITQKITPRRTRENPKTTLELPPFVQPCRKISNTNNYTNYNIFTQFGDLSPSQMVSLFEQFRNWPEYRQSPFLALMENSLLKGLTGQEDATTVVFDAKQSDEMKSL